MAGFYSSDPCAGVREVFDTLEEALECARINLDEYRKSAVADGEWMKDAEDVAVGHDPETGEEDDVPTHKATFVGDDENGYDCVITPLPLVPSSPSIPLR